jgi:cyanophycinase-like exopeptidase
MSKVHRELIDRFGSRVPAVVIDTPVGFQLNADDVTARAVEYFEESVQKRVEVCSFRDADKLSPFDEERSLKRLREALYIFCGPGSPTYALKQWNGSRIPQLLRDKLRSGGCVTFASAAACTLGLIALPVYEIYKVGESLRWARGLDLLSECRLPVAVIPHYNNREGGTHDTRYCYMGEPRLRALEEMMPDDAFILGVDEHTACIIDLDSDEMAVIGVGEATIRKWGGEVRLASDSRTPLGVVREMGGGRGLTPVQGPVVDPVVDQAVGTPFWVGIEELRAAFGAAMASGDLGSAIDAVLAVDDYLWSWSHESFGTDELIRARAIFREMVTRVGEEAVSRPRDPRAAIAPYIEAMLRVRERARSEERWDEADAIRDALLAEGIEIHDGPRATDWRLKD